MQKPTRRRLALHKTALILVYLLAPFVTHVDADSRCLRGADIVVHSLPEIHHRPFGDVYRAEYPIVQTGDSRVDSFILSQSIVAVFGDDCAGMSLDDAYLTWSDSLTWITSYDVEYNTWPYFSFVLQFEGCGARCSQWSTYLNFSTASGELLTIHSLLDSNESFSRVIAEEYHRQLQQYKEEMIGVFAEDNGYSKEEAAKDVSEILDPYVDNLRFIGFSISEKGVILRYGVYFPGYLRCYDLAIVVEINREDYPKFFLKP